MLSKLDKAMKQFGVDAVLVQTMDGMASPLFRYLTRAPLHNGGFYIKVSGQEPIVLAASDFEVPTFRKESVVKNVKGFSEIKSKDKTTLSCLDVVLKDFGLEKWNQIAVYDPFSIELYSKLKKYWLGISPPAQEKDALQQARITKDQKELEYIRQAGEMTQRVLGRALKFFRNCQIKNNKLYRNNKLLTIGDAKTLFNVECINEGLLNSDGLIFSQGAEGAEPHNTGTDSLPVYANTPTIIDFYPFNPKTGYWFDMTRTVVFGKASSEVKKVYELVLQAQQVGEDYAKAGGLCNTPYEKVCNFFESKGHKTARGEPTSLHGFIHGLGHGIGTQVHEPPWLSGKKRAGKSILRANSVFSNEPGLYLPGKFGIRLEDILVCRNGKPVNLATFPKELEL